MARQRLIVLGVVVALALAGWAVFRSPWRQLARQYGASVRTQDSTAIPRWTVSVTGPSRVSWATYRETVGVRFLPTGIELWQRPPVNVLYGPLRIPFSAVSRCAVFMRDAPVTVAGLWLEREAEWLVFETGRDAALEWCKQHGLRIEEETGAR